MFIAESISVATAVECGSEMLVAAHRISKFLSLPEPDELAESTDVIQPCSGAIEIDGVDFDWVGNSAEEASQQAEPSPGESNDNTEMDFAKSVSV